MLLIVEFIDIAIQLYIVLIFVYVILGYFPNLRGTKLYYLFARVCDPILDLFRWASFSGISIAPILASVFLGLISELLHYLYF